MDETADIPPDPREVSVRFSVDPRFEEPKDLNFERKREVLDRAGGGLRIVGFRGAQSKIPGKLQNALRALKFQDGRWQMFLRDHQAQTGANFPIYTWQNGCWEMVREEPWIHEVKKQVACALRRSMKRSAMVAQNEINILAFRGAEPSGLAKKPNDWKRKMNGRA